MRTGCYPASSLDGFIATPDDALEWLFPRGDLDETGYPWFLHRVGVLTMPERGGEISCAYVEIDDQGRIIGFGQGDWKPANHHGVD